MAQERLTGHSDEEYLREPGQHAARPAECSCEIWLHGYGRGGSWQLEPTDLRKLTASRPG